MQRRPSVFVALLMAHAAEAQLAKAGLVVLALLATGSCRAEPAPRHTTQFLDDAVDVGTWLLAMSDTVEAGRIPDRLGSSESTSYLGVGAGGRALFFAELYSATSQPRFREAAVASAQWAVDESSTLADPGLYGGLSGVAIAALEVARVVNEDELRVAARRILDLVARTGERTDVNDILAGRAGIGLTLIAGFEEFGARAYLEAALELGDTLLALADSTPNAGLRWMRGETSPFDLPNFSHGTAGVGYFLTRLGDVGGDPRFVAAGARAARYLDHIAVQSEGRFLVPYGVPNEGFTTPYDIGWAHGPAGTGRFHYLLWALHGDEGMRVRLQTDVETLLATGMPGPTADSTIWAGPFPRDRRFGTSGAGAFLLDWALVSGSDEALQLASEIVGDILVSASRSESGLHWRVPLYGFQDGEGDAVFTGYFHGAAGFGMLLLQRHFAEAGLSPTVRLPDDPFPRRPTSQD